MSDVIKNLKFDQTEIEKVEKDFSKLQLHPGQRGMVDSMARIMTGFLPISSLAIKGFTWTVMQNWQSNNQKTMEDLHTMSMDETIEATKEMLADSKKIYMKLLWKATPEEKATLDKSFDHLFKESIKMIQEQRR
ncbi:MAG: hypothetical protein ACTSUP_09300 [Candidatus Heimdallarchaeaceae archaeon]